MAVILSGFILSVLPVSASVPVSQQAQWSVASEAEEPDGEAEKENKTYEGVVPGINYEVVYYDEGFFGFTEKGDFRQWSLAHILPLLFTATMIALLYRARHAIRSWKYEEEFRFCFVFVMLMTEMGYFWRLLYTGPSDPTLHTMMSKLPLQVCQWTLISTCFAMTKKSETLFSMDFFLTMSFGLLPLFLPAVISTTGPRYFRYYQFWGEHILPILGVYYMMFVHGMKPRPVGMFLAAGMVLCLVPPALYFNSRFEDATYLYLKPQSYEMLSFLPNSLPVLILIGLILILTLFFAAYRIYLFIAGHAGASQKRA